MEEKGTKYSDELFAHKENGKLVVKSWVFENGQWIYRELTDLEVKAVIELTGVDKTFVKEVMP